MEAKLPAGQHQSALYFRFGGSNHNTLQLNEIEAVIHHARLAIAYSIECEIGQPKTYHRKLTSQATSISESFEFARPQKGSFVVVINAPKRTAEQARFPGVEDRSVETRAMIRMARGLHSISSKDTNELNSEFARASVQNGLNANIAINLWAAFEFVSANERSLSFNFPDVSTENSIPLSYSVTPRLLGNLRRFHEVLTGVPQ